MSGGRPIDATVKTKAPAVLVQSATRVQIQLERDADGRARVPNSTLVTYGSRNENGYLHVPGAARASLQARRDSGRKLTMGYQHYPYEPLTVIGAWDSWNESSTGVQASGLISDTSAGRDAATLVDDEAIAGVSIGFRCAETPDETDPVQLLAPGQTGQWQTPYGAFSYTADDWTVCFSAIEVDEASLVHEPADQGSWIGQMLQTFSQAAKAMPALTADDAEWEDVAYSMALLMGGRGAAAFTDIGDVEHFIVYQRLAGRYQAFGHTPPDYSRQPDYRQVQFNHDERDVFADRYLRKSASSLTATARGIQGQLSQETSEVVNQARVALAQLVADGRVQTNGPLEELRLLTQQSGTAIHALQKETDPND